MWASNEKKRLNKGDERSELSSGVFLNQWRPTERLWPGFGFGGWGKVPGERFCRCRMQPHEYSAQTRGWICRKISEHSPTLDACGSRCLRTHGRSCGEALISPYHGPCWHFVGGICRAAFCWWHTDLRHLSGRRSLAHAPVFLLVSSPRVSSKAPLQNTVGCSTAHI